MNTNGSIVNLNNYFQSYGPYIPRHNLNISGIANLPWGFELSVNSSIISRTPVEALTPGIDLSGTAAVASGPLPGMPYDCLGITCGKAQLAAAVASFDATYAGTKAANGQTIPALMSYPPTYQLGKTNIRPGLPAHQDIQGQGALQSGRHLLARCSMHSISRISRVAILSTWT